MPPDRSGIIQVVGSVVANDGQAYAYGYERQNSKAVVVTGVR